MANDDDDVFINVWPKQCAVCLHTYTPQTFAQLPPKATTEATEFGPAQEYRDCPCHNTLCITAESKP